MLDPFIEGLRSGLAVLLHKGNQMDNQHRMIRGYRELDHDEIDLMNEIKREGETLGRLVDKLRAIPNLDQRWVAIGATDLQTGLMALVRAVTKPTSF